MRTVSGTRKKAPALAVEVHVPAERRSFAALAHHLSPEGVFVSTFHTVREGTHVVVDVALGGGTVRANGAVAHVRDPRSGTAGFSVAFDALAPSDRARIERAMDAMNGSARAVNHGA